MGEPPAPVDAVQPLVGRDRERSLLDAYAARLADGPSGFVLRGESGIGKTALWRAAVVALRTDGRQVLVARPAAEERAIGLGGLTDLLGEHDDEVAALDPDDAGSAAGRATLTALRALAAEGPVVVAIDDLQWLDAASARALRFALRRLEARADRPAGDGAHAAGRGRPRRAVAPHPAQRLGGARGRAARARRAAPRCSRARRSRGRCCSASTRSRAATRCTPSSWPAASAGRDAAGGAEPLAAADLAARGDRAAAGLDLPPGLARCSTRSPARADVDAARWPARLPEAELEAALAAAEREELLLVGERLGRSASRTR